MASTLAASIGSRRRFAASASTAPEWIDVVASGASIVGAAASGLSIGATVGSAAPPR
jgi:hypothetical protein